MSTARNLKVINSRTKKEAPAEYVPSALEVRHDELITDIRCVRKAIRKEAVMLRKIVLAVLFLNLASTYLWVSVGTYAHVLMGFGTLLAIGVVGAICVVGTLATALFLTAIAYALEDEAKKLSKEV